MRIDRAVGADVVDRLQPLGIEAAFAAIEAQHATCGEKRRHIELALEQARYEATRAGRQYDAVDPENRIVATELERYPCLSSFQRDSRVAAHISLGTSIGHEQLATAVATA